MRFSYTWIREFVEDLHVPAQDLERLITIKTAECEGVEPYGALLGEACAARVEAVEPIEGARNVKATVDTVRYGVKTVVCGAPNCREGIVTAYAPIGVKTVSGIESDGMLASAEELGINKDGDGILELQSHAGASIPGCGPDSIIEIDNKSLTHRPDLWGHHGMAREVAAITGKRLKDPVRPDLLPSGPGAVQVEIADPALCPRYSALVYENVAVRPSPLWLQYRLTAIGLNPINNIVDLTNYVLAELPQPMHAFDQNKLAGGTIFIRPARSGESLRALNGETYELNPSNLVIADAAGPIALAGVIGGADSAIGANTSRIVFESANFSASSVRKTSSALKIRTDASMRFEKALDPANTVRGLARIVELMPLVCPGAKLVGGSVDAGAAAEPLAPVVLMLGWLQRKLGKQVPAATVQEILESLEFGVTVLDPETFLVQVPSWRATKDISVPDDLVEEVGRMIGYDTIEPCPPAVAAVVPPDAPERLFYRSLRALFTSTGYTEVSNYSFISDAQAERFGMPVEQHLKVLNPIAANQNLMRLSLLPGIAFNIAENSKHFEKFRIFEIGREIHKREQGLPDEVPHLLAAVFAKDDGREGLLALKSALGAVAPGAVARPVQARIYEHPARTAEIYWHDRVIGRLFELHPNYVEAGRGAVLDLDLRSLLALRPALARYQPVSRYPVSAFDLSIVTPARALAGDLESALRASSGPLLQSIEYLREYSGPPLVDGTKSVSFRLTLGAARTLSSEDAAAFRNELIGRMRAAGYDLRV